MKARNLSIKRANLLLCMAGILIVSISACKKESHNPVQVTQTAPTGPYLYVGGGTADVGVYWKISLSDAAYKVTTDTVAHAGFISSIVSSGSDIYIAAKTAGYYKNNSFVPVTTASSINYVAVSGSNVFTAGFDNTLNMAYWSNNTETNLGSTIGRNLFPDEGVSTYGLSGIAASGNNAFLSGSLFFENEPFTPASVPNGNFGLLWNNGNVQVFGQGVLISAVFNATAGVAVSGSDVYVAGILPDNTHAGGYWKNGVWNSINNGMFQPTSAATFGADTYITGYTYTSTKTSYNQQGAYWKNGTLVNFMIGTTVNAVAFNGTDMYVLGVDYNGNNVVWKNNAVFKTLGAANSQLATGMAIGN